MNTPNTVTNATSAALVEALRAVHRHGLNNQRDKLAEECGEFGAVRARFHVDESRHSPEAEAEEVADVLLVALGLLAVDSRVLEHFQTKTKRLGIRLDNATTQDARAADLRWVTRRKSDGLYRSGARWIDLGPFVWSWNSKQTVGEGEESVSVTSRMLGHETPPEIMELSPNQTTR